MLVHNSQLLVHFQIIRPELNQPSNPPKSPLNPPKNQSKVIQKSSKIFSIQKNEGVDTTITNTHTHKNCITKKNKNCTSNLKKKLHQQINNLRYLTIEQRRTPFKCKFRKYFYSFSIKCRASSSDYLNNSFAQQWNYIFDVLSSGSAICAQINGECGSRYFRVRVEIIFFLVLQCFGLNNCCFIIIRVVICITKGVFCLQLGEMAKFAVRLNI
jgi:hypothetical protein